MSFPTIICTLQFMNVPLLSYKICTKHLPMSCENETYTNHYSNSNKNILRAHCLIFKYFHLIDMAFKKPIALALFMELGLSF